MTSRPPIERVTAEKEALDGNIKRLRGFILDNPAYPRLSAEHQDLSVEQQRAMETYTNILGRRLALFAQEA